MEPFNLELDIQAAILNYPRLNIVRSADNGLSINGEIEIIDEATGSIVNTFSVELKYPKEFPYCFPKAFETGGKIERIADRHVYPSTGNLCLTVEAEERMLCRYGITTAWFLNKVLVPRLAEEHLVINGQPYKREFSHGPDGVWEFYMKKLNTRDENVVLRILETVAKKQLPAGHHVCICGSGKKFKKCHLESSVEISTLDSFYIWRQLEYLNNNPFKK